MSDFVLDYFWIWFTNYSNDEVHEDESKEEKHYEPNQEGEKHQALRISINHCFSVLNVKTLEHVNHWEISNRTT